MNVPTCNDDFGSLIKYFFREYLPTHKGVSVNTIKSYRDTFKLFLSWILKNKQCKSIDVGKIKPMDILNFLKFLEESRLNSAQTRNVRLAAIKVFFSMCYVKRATDKRELEAILFIPMKRFNKPLIDFFDHDDVLRVFSAVDRSNLAGVRDYLILNLLYDTGMRASEICGLRIQNFDSINETLEILGKGNRWRKIRIWPRTNQLLIDYVNNWRSVPKHLYKDHLLISHRREALTRFGIHKICGKYLKKAKIKKQLSNTKRSSAHSWRHTAAVNMLRMGLSIQEIKVRLGHANSDTTAKYLNLDLSIKRERVAEFIRFTEALLPVKASAESLAWQASDEVLRYLETL